MTYMNYKDVYMKNFLVKPFQAPQMKHHLQLGTGRLAEFVAEMATVPIQQVILHASNGSSNDFFTCFRGTEHEHLGEIQVATLNQVPSGCD